ncbi:MAG: metallopeptidase family protein [Sedimentisphaerales bacterium]|nr:metallopeptidase family protein [Sedimentisphaerales bacterium]
MTKMNLNRQQFDALVERALAQLPEMFSHYLEEVPVVVEDIPTSAVLTRVGLEKGHILLGVFMGVPLKHRHVMADAGPNQIILYRRNLLAAADDPEDLAERIRRTVVHELGHYVGFSEQELRQAGY